MCTVDSHMTWNWWYSEEQCISSRLDKYLYSADDSATMILEYAPDIEILIEIYSKYANFAPFLLNVENRQ